LIQQADDGQIELAYVDEAGFSLAPPIRSAWSRPGETHQAQPQKAGRLNVMGALFSSGKLCLARLWETVKAPLFAGFLGLIHERVDKPLVVIVDNASIHESKEISPMLRLLEKKGLTLYFLPPYSPELNRIEILWRKIKYEWLPFRKHSREELEQAMDHIESRFGSDYELTFC
jgi:transposase